TLLTIARDVKIQVEFNPALVAEYRLVGYGNRMLREEDFANDRVDAGDIGAGHEVTALYEIALAGSGGERLAPLRYANSPGPAAHGGELAHLRLRYKQPDGDASRLIEVALERNAIRADASPALRFAATVAAFADALRGGHNLGRWDWDSIASGARSGRADDRWGLRGEFAELVEAGRSVTRGGAARDGDWGDAPAPPPLRPLPGPRRRAPATAARTGSPGPWCSQAGAGSWPGPPSPRPRRCCRSPACRPAPGSRARGPGFRGEGRRQARQRSSGRSSAHG